MLGKTIKHVVVFPSIRICLVGWILERMEKRKILVSVWLKGREEKKNWWGPGVLLSRHTKMFSPQIWEKPKGNKSALV